ncbi:hypothetical protein IV498_15575 [Paenarthrobacter sp. Z7-10]|uniref:hypothetical protein n=1 Tax=Paenarthrobacter sp. Z7-10 TaxID=2787635 RepID=UPI0022A94772|nr:hypothetical protein [Paenarthrobacter sp. Z7-10]MCZ2404558.1 hypothetical protein [Paenarthrobacter sp. Z7-10]
MDEPLVQVWAAAADLESLAADVDRATLGLDIAIADAIAAERDVTEIRAAANLTEVEFQDRIDAARDRAVLME